MTLVRYAADWSEYFGHQPPDGSGDVYFHLDPLWASPDIDAIGIDVYWPLADWRDGRDHLDSPAGVARSTISTYLRANIARRRGLRLVLRQSAADRDAQVRTPDHRRRRQAVGVPLQGHPVLVAQPALRPSRRRRKSATPTAWVPQSKPFWFMEIGCPAVDKGANQPNVFVDPKSSETALPYYSRGARDDFMQRRYLQAPSSTASTPARRRLRRRRQPGVGRLRRPHGRSRAHPRLRLGCAALSGLSRQHRTSGATATTGASAIGSPAASPARRSPRPCAQLLADYGFADLDAGALNGIVPGYVIDRVMSARDALQPLELAYFFDPLRKRRPHRLPPSRRRAAGAPSWTAAISSRRAPTAAR